MECCQCQKEMDLSKKQEYEYDYVGDLWCKECMEIEIHRDIKTCKAWSESRKSLHEFFDVGDIVDEALKEYFLDVLPPVTFNSALVQLGEPYSHVNGKATFPTLCKENGNWVYKGNCYRGEIENRE